jgi:hypothetical protein
VACGITRRESSPRVAEHREDAPSDLFRIILALLMRSETRRQACDPELPSASNYVEPKLLLEPHNAT